MRLFKMRSEVDQLLFPEMLGKVIIINTPSLFSYVYAMLSPMLDVRTRSKVRPATVSYHRCAPFVIALRQLKLFIFIFTPPPAHRNQF